MTPLIQECATGHTPESLVDQLRSEPGVVLLRAGSANSERGRYSIVTARPFLTFQSAGAECRSRRGTQTQSHFGNPWQILESWIARYELLDQIDLPFPLGGCFGYWGYDLRSFVEPARSLKAVNDLEIPDCFVGFYDSLVVFDHHLAKTWIVSTGLTLDGSRDADVAQRHFRFWQRHLERSAAPPLQSFFPESPPNFSNSTVHSTFTRSEFMAAVARAQQYIRAGDIYQVNLAQRFTAQLQVDGWSLWRRLTALSPAPFAAYLDCGEFQIASSSPELFLRLSGKRVLTRPIKGTRPRSSDPTKDTQLAYELQTSPKELAELLMITDLLRNDLGKICEYGTVHVPELVTLERFAHVQHLVSTVEGLLHPKLTHLSALASCFPGGSITGAPKIRAMEIIDELEPVTRGPYTGALGYIGFNRESQLSIIIRTAVCRDHTAWFHAGAGIVADSQPEAEYAETLAKARGFFDALQAEFAESAVPSLFHH